MIFPTDLVVVMVRVVVMPAQMLLTATVVTTVVNGSCTDESAR